MGKANNHNVCINKITRKRKVKYETREEAQAVLNEMGKGQTYRCKVCGYFHCSSQNRIKISEEIIKLFNVAEYKEPSA